MDFDDSSSKFFEKISNKIEQAKEMKTYFLSNKKFSYDDHQTIGEKL